MGLPHIRAITEGHPWDNGWSTTSRHWALLFHGSLDVASFTANTGVPLTQHWTPWIMSSHFWVLDHPLTIVDLLGDVFSHPVAGAILSLKWPGGWLFSLLLGAGASLTHHCTFAMQFTSQLGDDALHKHHWSLCTVFSTLVVPVRVSLFKEPVPSLLPLLLTKFYCEPPG